MIKKILLLLSLIAASKQLFGLEFARDPIGGGHGGEFVRPQFDEQVNQLWLACKAGDEVKAAQLLQTGVNANTRLFFEAPLDEEGSDNSTCLHYAASAGHLGIVDLLFQYGAQTNPRDQNEWIPLIGALAGGHETVVDRLIKKGAQVNSIDNYFGHRPIATPVQCLNPRLVRTLLATGAGVIPPPMTFHNNVPLVRIYQGGALHILCQRLKMKPVYAPEYDAQEKEDRALEIIEMVRAHGIDMSHQDDDGNTVYHVASGLNNKRIIAALIMVSTNYIKPIRQAALAKLKTVLLANEREDNGLPALPREVILRIFSYMPIECKQAGSVDLQKLIVPHYVDVASMRTRHLDACLVDLKKHSWYTKSLPKILGIMNKGEKQAYALTTDPLLQQVLKPIYWH